MRPDRSATASAARPARGSLAEDHAQHAALGRALSALAAAAIVVAVAVVAVAAAPLEPPSAFSSAPPPPPRAFLVARERQHRARRVRLRPDPSARTNFFTHG